MAGIADRGHSIVNRLLEWTEHYEERLQIKYQVLPQKLSLLSVQKIHRESTYKENDGEGRVSHWGTARETEAPKKRKEGLGVVIVWIKKKKKTRETQDCEKEGATKWERPYQQGKTLVDKTITYIYISISKIV